MEQSQSRPRRKQGKPSVTQIGAGLRALQQFLAYRQIGIRYRDEDRRMAEYGEWLRYAHEALRGIEGSSGTHFQAVFAALDSIRSGLPPSSEQSRDAVYALHQLIETHFPAKADAADFNMVATQ